MASRSPPFRYEVSVSGITTTVTCRGSLLNDNVDELKQLVKPMIPICRPIVIEPSDVNVVDSAGLGALGSLKVSAAERRTARSSSSISRRLGENCCTPRN